MNMSLQREPSGKRSHRRDEQFLDSEGPPPLDVPKKVTENIGKYLDQK